MRITGFHTTRVNVPLAKPIATAIHRMQSVGCVLLELKTDQGLTGESYVFTLNGVRLKSLGEMLDSFSESVSGRDPHDLTAIGDEIWGRLNPIGHAGFGIAALCAIDTACWDLVGKRAGLPLHRLFGACRDRVWTYASGSLWLSQSIDEIVSEAGGLVDAGFRAMKIRLGSARIADDVARVAAVRDAVGPDIELLTDANQGLDVKHAIRLGRALERHDVRWFEEPVAYNNLAGNAEVRASVGIDIAGGETEYTRFGMKNILDARAVDVLMPDLQRVGGLSEMRRVAAIASGYHVPISPHLFTEHSLCIAGSEPNCISLEHMPWFSPLFNETLEIEDGHLLMPDRPGVGFTFDRQAIASLRGH